MSRKDNSRECHRVPGDCLRNSNVVRKFYKNTPRPQGLEAGDSHFTGYGQMNEIENPSDQKQEYNPTNHPDRAARAANRVANTM